LYRRATAALVAGKPAAKLCSSWVRNHCLGESTGSA
jgi:hypothetical protein